MVPSSLFKQLKIVETSLIEPLTLMPFCNVVNASPKSTMLKKYYFLFSFKSHGSTIFHPYGQVEMSILVVTLLVKCLGNAKSTPW